MKSLIGLLFNYPVESVYITVGLARTELSRESDPHNRPSKTIERDNLIYVDVCGFFSFVNPERDMALFCGVI